MHPSEHEPELAAEIRKKIIVKHSKVKGGKSISRQLDIPVTKLQKLSSLRSIEL